MEYIGWLVYFVWWIICPNTIIYNFAVFYLLCLYYLCFDLFWCITVNKI